MFSFNTVRTRSYPLGGAASISLQPYSSLLCIPSPIPDLLVGTDSPIMKSPGHYVYILQVACQGGPD